MGQGRSWMPVVVLLVLLAGSNVMSNRLLSDGLYVPWSLAVAALVLLIAVHVDGLDPHDVGLSRATLGRGVCIGGFAVGLTLVIYLLAAALPATRDLFDDARIEDLGLAGVLYYAFVRVPLGTVVLEEVAFRGVLPAVLASRLPLRRAVASSQALFGLWHVLPSTNLAHRNPVIEDRLGDASVVMPVILAILFTAMAGVVLWLLRRWADNLAAPALAHWSTNGLGYLLAHLVG